MHPKRIGDRSTLAIMLALQEAGFELLLPFGENTRYDLVIDDGMSLARVQCKTGRLRRGAVVFATCSAYGHHRNPKTARRDYSDQVDSFAVYCPETAGVYLIPIEDLSAKAQGSLRVAVPRNGQKRRIRFAADYRIGYIPIGRALVTPEPGVCSGAG